MKIGIAGPVDVGLLRGYFQGHSLPDIYSFPLISKLVIELRRRGHEITVFCGSQEVSETVHIAGDGIALYICPRRRKMAYDFYRREREFLTEAMNQSDCEIIHAHWTYEFAVSALASNKKTLVTAHDAPLIILFYFLHPGIFPHWFMRILLGTRVMHTAPHLSAVSPYIARHIEKWYFPKNKVHVTPNGIDESIFSMVKPHEREIPVPLVVSAINGWGRLKNAKSALKAFSLFRQEFPDAQYQIYGIGYERGGVAQQWAKDRGLAAGVEFFGRISHDDLMVNIAQCDVLLHPSLEESFGMSICEAMALGVPVIGGRDSGAVPFVLDYGNAGVLVDVRSPSKMKDALYSLMKNSSLREELGACGKQVVRRNFTLVKMADRYESIYEQLLASK